MMTRFTEDDLRRHYNVTMSADEARRFLDDLASDRVRVVPGPYYGTEVFYGGRWRRLSRVDLFDQVATGRVRSRADVEENPVRFWRDMIVYGVRVKDDLFMMIDSLTDG